MIVIALIAFVGGVVVGILIETRYELTHNGKALLVIRSRKRLARFVPRGGRTWAVLLVTATLVANTAVGFLLLNTRGTVERQAEALRSNVECQGRYNRAQGEALVPRDAAAKGITAAEVDLWTNYLATFQLARKADNAGDMAELERLQVEFAHRIRQYRNQLRGINATRYANPYPDPDLCATLTPTRSVSP